MFHGFLSYCFLSTALMCPYESEHVLFASLNPSNIPHQLIFHRLFPNSSYGQQALQQALDKLHISSDLPADTLVKNREMLDSLIEVVTRAKTDQSLVLPQQTRRICQALTHHLPHRTLEGHKCTQIDTLLQLPDEEFDLARGLLLEQLGPDKLDIIESYEAFFDLLALQILATVPADPTPEQLIATLNTHLFEHMHIRFPPESVFRQDIDLYTDLPSVVDSRRGVCLGVSILYLCLAQRLNLPLEIITPPGHIFVRYARPDKRINIETTCRGVHLPDHAYYSLTYRQLERRSLKEVIGMVYVNQASVLLHQQKISQAQKNYQQALMFMPQDPLVLELLGYTHYMLGEQEQGQQCLANNPTPNPLASDLLFQRIDPAIIPSLFSHTSCVNRDEKIDTFQALLKQHPNSQALHFELASLYSQTHQTRKALDMFLSLHTLNPRDLTTEVTLAMLYLERFNLPKALEHYRIAKSLVEPQDPPCKPLEQIQFALENHINILS